MEVSRYNTSHNIIATDLKIKKKFKKNQNHKSKIEIQKKSSLKNQVSRTVLSIQNLQQIGLWRKGEIALIWYVWDQV